MLEFNWTPMLTVRSTQMSCRKVRGCVYRGLHTPTPHTYTHTHLGTPLPNFPESSAEFSRVQHPVESRWDSNRDGQLGHCWS